MIATELLENMNTVITNLCEYLVWKVGRSYLPGHREHAHPFDWVEHNPADPTHPPGYGCGTPRSTSRRRATVIVHSSARTAPTHQPGDHGGSGTVVYHPAHSAGGAEHVSRSMKICSGLTE